MSLILPYELWETIFSIYSENCSLVSIILVCRAWAGICDPLSFRHLYVSKVATAKSLIRRLQDRPAFERAPYRQTRCLTVKATDCSHTILMPTLRPLYALLPSLRSIRLHGSVKADDLKALAASCAESLHVLHLKDIPTENQVQDFMDAINLLHRLKILNMGFNDVWDGWHANGLTRLFLPELQDLTLTTREEVLRPIASCRFPTVKRVTLDMRRCDYPATVKAFNEFLAKHRTSITEFTLSISETTHMNVAALTCLPSMEKLKCLALEWIPSPGELRGLPLSVRKLTLPFAKGDMQAYSEKLRVLFDALIHQSHTHIQIVEIETAWRRHYGERNRHEHDQYPIFDRMLIERVEALRDRGVEVADMTGLRFRCALETCPTRPYEVVKSIIQL